MKPARENPYRLGLIIVTRPVEEFTGGGAGVSMAGLADVHFLMIAMPEGN
jgi:hypothetical protein